MCRARQGRWRALWQAVPQVGAWTAQTLCALLMGWGLGTAVVAAPTGAPAGAPALSTAADTRPAPRPLYRDPVHDGAADPSLIYNRHTQRWEMFYTNRRATLRLEDPKDVRWVHGTHIGIATTEDGQHWRHLGVAQFPPACSGPTDWAPEIVEHQGTYHLWLTVVPGVHARWQGTRYLQHLTSTDLRQWRCEQRLQLGSERAIDATVLRLPQPLGGGWRLWFKDENQGSQLFAADSPDLRQWTVRGPVTRQAAEGAKVFFFGGRWWMVADVWRGLLVQRSDDLLTWEAQATRLLAEPGQHATDRAKGQHPDVVVRGDRAFLFYFVHQGGEPEAKDDERFHQRSVIQVAELKLQDGWLVVDRDAPPPDLRRFFGAGQAPR